MKNFLKNRSTITELINYDSTLSDDVLESISKHLEDKKRSFKKEVIEYKSAAALPLAEWVESNIK